MIDTKDLIVNICRFNYHFLINKANVVGLCLGTKIVKGIDTLVPCITVFVEKKLALSKILLWDIIPPIYCGCKTDVIQTGAFTTFSLTEKIRPFPCGCSIGVGGTATTLPSNCTSGCIVNAGNTPCILTCNHSCALPCNNIIGTPIIQPCLIDGGDLIKDVIGKLFSFIPIFFQTFLFSPCNYIDACLIKINNLIDITGSIAHVGDVCGLNLKPLIGMVLQKFGKTTELTTCTLKCLYATIKCKFPNGKHAIFCDQLLTTACGKPGDSGSVLLDDKKCIVGLLFAGCENFCVLNPIGKVFSSLNISLPQ